MKMPLGLTIGKDLQTEIQDLQQRILDPFFSLSPILAGQDYVAQFSRANELNELMRQLEPHRQMFASFAASAADLGLVPGVEATTSLAQLQHQHTLKLIAERQQLLETIQRQVYGSATAAEYVQQLSMVGTYSAAVEQARRSMEGLRSTFPPRDFSMFDADEDDQQEATLIAQSITHDIAESVSLEDTVKRIVLAIDQAKAKPGVQVMLWLLLCWFVKVFTEAAVAAAMSHYAPVLLGDSTHADKKEVQESARALVGSPNLLTDYRYIAAKVLIVRQNPGARSPEVGRLSFGKAVKLLSKEKEFALVIWADKESGAQIQGWVFARYLEKFN